jgi:hypothetical protein
LGGTTLRVGHDGFTKSAAPRILTGGYLEHVPYLAYEYWWDEEGHRYIPFELSGGYGDDLEPGQITSFRHYLDIQAGLMTIDMDLRGRSGLGRAPCDGQERLPYTPRDLCHT